MPYTQLDNPQGAFGYQNTESTGSQPLGPSQNYPGETRVLRNASTVLPIQPGMPVVLSTGSSRGDLVQVGATADDVKFVGIAITSAGLNTTATTVAGTTGLGNPGTDWCEVLTHGVFHGALLSSAAVADDALSVSASTGTTASGTTGPGSLGVAATTGTAGHFGVAGIALTSGTTGTTGWLTTAGPRGVVFVRPSIVPLTSV